MASQSELNQIWTAIQKADSRIDVLEERLRGLEYASGAPSAPISADLSGIEERVLKLEAEQAPKAETRPDEAPGVTEEELAQYRGKRGRKPPRIQKALDAEKTATEEAA